MGRRLKREQVVEMHDRNLHQSGSYAERDLASDWLNMDAENRQLRAGDPAVARLLDAAQEAATALDHLAGGTYRTGTYSRTRTPETRGAAARVALLGAIHAMPEPAVAGDVGVDLAGDLAAITTTAHEIIHELTLGSIVEPAAEEDPDADE